MSSTDQNGDLTLPSSQPNGTANGVSTAVVNGSSANGTSGVVVETKDVAGVGTGGVSGIVPTLQ
jgi:hypothetical protein